VSDLYPPLSLGGHEIGCKFLADGLEAKGHRLLVLTSNFGKGAAADPSTVCRSLRFITHSERGAIRRFNEIRGAILARLNYTICRQVIRNYRPEIIIAGQLNGVSIFPLRAARDFSIPVVHVVGNYYLLELLRDCERRYNPIKRIYGQCLSGFRRREDLCLEHITVHSDAVNCQHVRSGIDSNRVTTIYPIGIAAKNVCIGGKSLRSRNSKFSLLFVGRLDTEKGINVAVDAVGLLVKRHGAYDIHFDIVGAGEPRQVSRLHRQIARLGLREFVCLRGRIPHRLISQEYRSADVLLVPSIWEEPFGLVTIEAMSQGLPVIASNVGGLPENVEHMKTGLLVPPNDSEKLAEAILKLKSDPTLCAQMSSNCASRVLQRYTDVIVINKYEEYLNNVLSRDSTT